MHPEVSRFRILIYRHLSMPSPPTAVAPILLHPVHTDTQAGTPPHGQHCAANGSPSSTSTSSFVAVHRKLLHAEMVGEVVDTGNAHSRHRLLWGGGSLGFAGTHQQHQHRHCN